eukprot:scaffold924_cov99-Isochrysis_galbana.AAC.2
MESTISATPPLRSSSSTHASLPRASTRKAEDRPTESSTPAVGGSEDGRPRGRAGATTPSLALVPPCESEKGRDSAGAACATAPADQFAYSARCDRVRLTSTYGATRESVTEPHESVAAPSCSRTARDDADAPGGCRLISRQSAAPSAGRRSEASRPCSSAFSNWSGGAAVRGGSQQLRCSGASACIACTCTGTAGCSTTVSTASASAASTASGGGACTGPNPSTCSASFLAWRRLTCSGVGSSETSTSGGRSDTQSGRHRARPDVASCTARLRASVSLSTTSSLRRWLPKPRESVRPPGRTSSTQCATTTPGEPLSTCSSWVSGTVSRPAHDEPRHR